MRTTIAVVLCALSPALALAQDPAPQKAVPPTKAPVPSKPTPVQQPPQAKPQPPPPPESNQPKQPVVVTIAAPLPSGRVLSSPPGIDCGTMSKARVCSYTFMSGEPIQLLAEAPRDAPGATVTWTPACSEPPSTVCVLRLAKSTTLVVTITPKAPPSPPPPLPPPPPPPPPPPLPPAKNVLKMGEMLRTKATLQSPGRTHYAIQQPDGNLCVYAGTPDKPGKHLWCLNTAGASGEYVTAMQGDGNLCVYRGTPEAIQPGPLWCSKTSGQTFLTLQDDGNLCVYRGTSPADNRGGLWCHNTNVMPPVKPITHVIPQYFRDTDQQAVALGNATPYGMWVTVYKPLDLVVTTSVFPTIVTARCVKSGTESHFTTDMPLRSKYQIRAEMTSTADCSALPGNRHVICDTRMTVERYDPHRHYFSAVLRTSGPGSCAWDGAVRSRP
ncbi:hypothetical protein [Usitatibacter palustris]|uniref:Bulb-type lectin domain-containing protein n=1 Tax=Usitatibacter palustris TaxID=2732487 RepID=A0A6M4H564_9PROT|nr:hypothetical protein [Usitatibacter palustris]QJR14746.1 hypothetical protein DSM104440_01556 [Usitatibacter palustris]